MLQSYGQPNCCDNLIKKITKMQSKISRFASTLLCLQALRSIQSCNMAKSTEEIYLMVQNSAIDESIKDILTPIIESLKVKIADIIQLKNKVTYQTKKVSEIQQYSSKDSIIFRNLPLISGRSIMEDVLTFINKQLGVQMDQKTR